jgi:3-phenylpropionate/trans-cinnamate dioxygenase ferredoxin subunit
MAAYAVCSEEDLPVGGMRAFRAGSVRVAVYHLADGWYATQAQCTHTFAPLARGKIVDGCQVQCPLHRARFDIATGKVVEWANFPPGIQLLDAVRGEKPLRTFPVRIKDGQVMVTT